MKKTLLSVVLVCVVVVLNSSAETMVTDPSVNSLPLSFSRSSHSAYRYFDRLETEFDIPLLPEARPFFGFHRHPVDLSNYPIPRGLEFDRYSAEARANQSIFRGEVVVSEDSRWSRLKQRLPGFLKNSSWLYGSGYHFAAWNYNGDFTATIQPVYGWETIDPGDERHTISRFVGGMRIEGGYKGNFHYLVDFRDHTESGNGPYWSRDSLYEDRWANVDQSGRKSTSYNLSESCLQYYGKDLSIAAGRGIFRWGPAQFGNLFLNSRMPPFDYVRFDGVIESSTSTSAIYYTFLHGFLESVTPADTLSMNPDGRARTINHSKYISAQRLEIRPRQNLLFGFSQGVVYGDRGVQLGYVTPLNFLYSVQHSTDDKDNFLLSLDGKWRITKGWKVYAEALFDDIIVSKLLSSSGSNKSAFTVGTQVVPPDKFWDKFNLKAEYTKIRPFVYSHVFSTNVYTHWNSPIGYTKEPNSEFMTLEVQGTFFPLQVTLHASRQNHGANRDTSQSNWNVGGDINQPRSGNERTDYPFLDGDLQRIDRIGIRLEYELLENLSLYGEGMQIREKGKANRTETRAGFGWNL